LLQWGKVLGDVSTNSDDEARIRKLVAEALAEERRDLDARLIEQEHRTTHIAMNLFNHARSNDEQLRQAAWRAALWRMFVPRSAAVAAVSAGLFTIALSGIGLLIGIRANTLLERQNERMDVQNMLTEAQRRSAFLASELSSISAQIDTDRRDSGIKLSDGALLKPSAATIGRIVSLTLALRPYRPVVIAADTAPVEDNILQKENGFSAYIARISEGLFPVSADTRLYRISRELISPERGQLLLALLPQKLDFNALTSAGATFDNADLSDSVVVDADLSGAKLDAADFKNAKLRNVKFVGAQLSGADFTDANVSYSYFNNATLNGTVFHRTTLHNIDFSEIQMLTPFACSVQQTFMSGISDNIDLFAPFLRCEIQSLHTPNKGHALRLANDQRAGGRIKVCVGGDPKVPNYLLTETECPRGYQLEFSNSNNK
jgi:hypothetical protein